MEQNSGIGMCLIDYKYNAHNRKETELKNRG